MTSRTGRFPRTDRILLSRDFQRVGRTGKRLASRNFVVLIVVRRELESDRRRLGVTVSRRVGNAVARNRVKRGIREWFRRLGDSRQQPQDMVIIARPSAARLTVAEVAQDLDRLMESGLKAGE